MKCFICSEHSVNLDKIQSIRKLGFLCFEMPNLTVPSSTRSVSVGGIYFQKQSISCIDGDRNCNQNYMSILTYIWETLRS